jgi:hypothetical protein
MTKAARYQFVRCATCGKVDQPTRHPHNAGTSRVMWCEDCCDPITKRALLCRACCPTGHGTDWQKLNARREEESEIEMERRLR